VTGNATNYKNSQGDNPICSTRDEISQPSRPISPRTATADTHWKFFFILICHNSKLGYSSDSNSKHLENNSLTVEGCSKEDSGPQGLFFN